MPARHQERTEVSRLRDALQRLQHLNGSISRRAAEAHQKLQKGQEPHPSEWPGKTPGDPALMEDGDVIPDFEIPEWKARKYGWPRLLDELAERLPQFQSALDDTQDSLDSLSAETLQRIDGVDGPGWRDRCNLAINELSKWLPAFGDDSPDLVNLIDWLRHSPPPETTELTKRFSQFDDHLRALGGLQNGTESGKDTSPGTPQKVPPSGHYEVGQLHAGLTRWGDRLLKALRDGPKQQKLIIQGKTEEDALISPASQMLPEIRDSDLDALFQRAQEAVDPGDREALRRVRIVWREFIQAADAADWETAVLSSESPVVTKLIQALRDLATDFGPFTGSPANQRTENHTPDNPSTPKVAGITQQFANIPEFVKLKNQDPVMAELVELLANEFENPVGRSINSFCREIVKKHGGKPGSLATTARRNPWRKFWNPTSGAWKARKERIPKEKREQ